MVAAGSQEAMTTLRGLLHRGPTGALVERVEEEPVQGIHGEAFRIVH